MNVTHSITLIHREDGNTGWACSCGQSSDMPWSQSVAAQQTKKHKEEHAAYEKLRKKMELDAKTAREKCVYCGRRAVKSPVTLPNDAGVAHKSCLRKALNDS